jgi:hypothetical protein
MPKWWGWGGCLVGTHPEAGAGPTVVTVGSVKLGMDKVVYAAGQSQTRSWLVP